MEILRKACVEIIARSWWVILFSIICYVLYEQGLKDRNNDYQLLSQHLANIQNETKKALIIQDTLLRKVNSQSDPSWVELTLMKGLGLVPEGQTKVLFAE